MIQETINFANEALRAFDEMENHIFTNHRARYATAKSVLDNYREEIEEMIRALNDNPDDETASSLKKDITAISESVNAAQDTGVIEPIKEMETLDSTINSMINDLDNGNNVETTLPTANIDIQAIENAMPTEMPMSEVVPEVTMDAEGVMEVPQVEVPVMETPQENAQEMTLEENNLEVPTYEQEIPQPMVEAPTYEQETPQQVVETVVYEQEVPDANMMVNMEVQNDDPGTVVYQEQVVQDPGIVVEESGQDVIPEVSQIVIEEAPMTEEVVMSSPEIQIMDGAATEVIQNVTPEITIVADQPEQVMEAQEITIPDGDAMIEVPNVEMNPQVPETFVTQEAQA